MRALALLLAIDAAVLAKVESPFSGDREKGVYALGRLHDPENREERARVDQAVMGGASGQLRAAALRGFCDRHWPREMSGAAVEIVMRALEDRDPTTVAAAAECTERVERSRAVKMLASALDSRRGEAYVLPVLAAAGRLGERSLEELAVTATDRLGFRLAGEPLVIDAKSSRALLALAALGADVEPTLSASIDEKKRDFFRDARANAIRAAAGDETAHAKLVETAIVAADATLRREAVDLLFLLPPEPRMRALRALESRVGDPDGGVRGRLVRELSRSAGAAEAWVEPMLLKAATDPFPDVRLQALCGLLDRRLLSAEARRALPEKDADPLAQSALRAVAALPAPTPSPTPAPVASPSPSPSPSPSSPPIPSPTPTPTPYRWNN